MKAALHAIYLAAILIGGVSGQQSASYQSMERTLAGGLPARWWRQPAETQKLHLSADQQKKMDDILLQSRLKLIDLNAALEKEETLLEPMVAADRLDETKIRAQIDRIAQARADLEKGNAYLLLGIRLVLSPEQWRDLKADAPRPRKARGDNPAEPPPATSSGPMPRKSR